MMEKLTKFMPAYDKRKEGYGVHCVELRMVLKGTLGAVQFVLLTGWYLPRVQKEGTKLPARLLRPIPADLGYHSPLPRYEGHESMRNCEYLDGMPCYYDGSGMAADRIYQILLKKGSDGVWKELEVYYKQIFGDLI